MDVFVVTTVTLWLILSIKIQNIQSLIPPDFVLQILRGRDGRIKSRCILERPGVNELEITCNNCNPMAYPVNQDSKFNST